MAVKSHGCFGKRRRQDSLLGLRSRFYGTIVSRQNKSPAFDSRADCLDLFQKLVRLGEDLILSLCEGDVSIQRRHEIADGVFVLMATLSQPLLQVLARSWSQL